MRSFLALVGSLGQATRRKESLDADRYSDYTRALILVSTLLAFDARGPKGFEGPGILGFLAAEDVAVAGAEKHAEISRAGRVPAILDRSHFDHFAVEEHTQGTLVGFVAGVTLDMNELVSHERAIEIGDSRQARRSKRRRER